jgi:hypothetical protein
MKTKYDLIVVGGGFAGSFAAIEAARHGADVLLIEKYNCLSGAAAYALVSPFMGFRTRMENGEMKNLAGDLFLEILNESKGIAGEPVPPKVASIGLFDEEAMKTALLRRAVKCGVNLLFNTTVTSANVENGVIKSITAVCKAVEMEFTADSFIDATGDGELSALCGCKIEQGRSEDGLCQPMTLCFRVGGVDKEKYIKIRPEINKIYKEWQKAGKIKNPRENVLCFNNYNDGVIHFNTTRVILKNPTDPFELTEAEIEAREQVYEMMNFLRTAIEGFENARLLSTALQIGIRESRRVMGEYVLCEEDLVSLARFDDAIAVSNYAIDIHNPNGTGTVWREFADGEWYEIPYRCLVPIGMNNLLVAGRCISSTHEAQASYRIMPFCAEIGQAAGCAAAVAKKNGTSVRAVDVSEVRNILRQEGFVI